MTELGGAQPVELPEIDIVTGDWQASLAATVDRIGAHRVAVVCGPGFERSVGMRDRLADLPVEAVRLWSSVVPHAPLGAVESLAAEVGEWRPDLVVSGGGGSAHDTTKGMVAVLAAGGRLLDRCLVYRPPDAPVMPALPATPLPVVTIPTTFAGSEANGAAGFTDEAEHRKRVVASRSLTPRAVLVDGAALATTPTDILRGSAMNAINHCVEGLASRRRHIVSEALLAKALGELAAASDALGPDRPDALTRASVASAVAGIGLTGSWLGLAHAIGHVVGARTGVPHGWCHAVLAGPIVRFNAAVRPEGHEIAASVLGVGRSSEQLAEWLDALASRWQLPRRLRDLGVTESDVPHLAEAAWRDHDTFYNPRSVTGPDELADLLAALY